MAKRKKPAKVQKRGKLPKTKSATRGKARRSKAAQGQAKKRTVAKAKPKPAPVKKAARRIKQPVVAPAVETTVIDVIEQPAPGVITVTEIEETEVRKAS
jgi:hypothetical protein